MQVVNFKLVPVRHQLNVMLVACIAWACFMSLIRASDPGPTGHEALQISDTHNRTVAVCSKTSDATNPWKIHPGRPPTLSKSLGMRLHLKGTRNEPQKPGDESLY